MPKTKLAKPRDPPFVKITRLIKGRGYTGNSLAPLMGCAPQTAKKKLDNPELFTVRELWMISQGADIPFEEMRVNIVR